MATVRKVGTTIEVPLDCDKDLPPEEQTTLVLKVLCFDEWRTLLKALMKLNPYSQSDEILEACRRVFGVALVDVKNLKIFDPATGEKELFQLKKVGQELTKESFESLIPWRDEIIERIREASTFGGRDLKN